jgi:hypothetical protein
MPEVVWQRRRSRAIAVPSPDWGGLGLMLVVAAPLAAPVFGRPAIVRAVHAPHAPVASPRLDEQRAVQTEALSRQKPLHACHLNGVVEQPRRRFMSHQAVPTLARRKAVPYRVIDAEADDTSEEHVLGQRRDELPTSAHAVEHRQQRCVHKLLRRDTTAASLVVDLVQRRKLLVPLCERHVDPIADWTAQGGCTLRVHSLHLGKWRFVIAVTS